MRLRPTILASWAVVLIANSTLAQAPAGDPAAEPAGYRAAVDAAIAEHAAGNFAESRVLFERAHALFPNARTLRGMGMAEFELRNYVASVQFLEQSLAASVKPLQDTLRSETEALLARARGFIGQLTLSLEPADARIALNGTSLQLGATRTVPLAVGDYTLETSAQGYVTDRRQVRIAGGGAQSVSVQLVKQEAVIAPAAQPIAAAPRAQESSSVFESPWLWTAVGVAVAGAAVGVGFAVSGGDPEPLKASGGTAAITLKGP